MLNGCTAARKISTGRDGTGTSIASGARNVERSGAGAGRRRWPSGPRDERAPARLRPDASRSRAASDRRALAVGALGLLGRERARVARPVPRAGVRPRSGRVRLQGAGRRVLRGLRAEDRGADPLRGRGALGAPERGPGRLPGRDDRRHDRSALRGRGDRRVPAAADPADPARGRGGGADALERLPQPGPAARRRGPRRGGGVVRRADRGRAAPLRAERLPLRRAPRPSPAALPRPRLLLVARRAQQVGCGGAGARRRARHDRGQRSAWRPHRRLPRPRTPRHDPRRVHDLVRGWHDPVRARPRGEHRAGRRQLSVAARRGRRVRRPRGARPPGGARGPRAGAAARRRPRSRPRARPRRRRRDLRHLGHRVHLRLQLAPGRRVRRERQAGSPPRRVVRARGVLPGPAVAVTTWIDVHLGRLARRQTRRRPHRDAERLPGVRASASTRQRRVAVRA